MKSSAAEPQGEAPVRGRRPVLLLVVGYGNTLRRDDGVGPKVAEKIEEAGWGGVEALACPQLTPEIAEPVSRAEAVVFVDAEVGRRGRCRIRPIAPRDSSQIVAHAADPSTILALARDAFGRTPRAWLLTVPAFDMEYGEDLSPRVRGEFPRALAMIAKLAGRSPLTASCIRPAGGRR